jgi:hypothetical protein
MRISNTLTNRQLYKKAYLIEFYGRDVNAPVDIFTFSVPPENEELTYSQRKTETKTFGGLHIDDYGIDAVKINLSGSTINQSLKRIYKANKDDKWLSGEEEVYYFRNLIAKYKSIDFLKANPGAKIVIYDLSKFTGLRATSDPSTNIENYWQAFPGDFKIRRSNDKPFTYKYTFEFTGVPFSGGARRGIIPMGSTTLGAVQRSLNGIRAALNFINGVEAWVEDAMGYVNQISSLLNILGSVMARSAAAITNIMGTAGGAAVGVINGATNVVDGANSVVSLPRTVQLKAMSIGLDLQNATNRLVKATARLSSNSRAVFEADTYRVPQEILNQSAMNNEEFKDSVNLMLNRAENHANELAVYTKSSEIPDVSEGNPDHTTGLPQIILSYGHSSIMIKDTDNLESLAAEYLGDPNRAIEIAAYNGVASLNDMSPGDVIRIPITARTIKIANNLIYSRREDRDNYGRDILLSDDGFIATSAGDYKVSSGVQNLTQAVLLRLRESNAKRIRVIAYGIRNNVSDPTAGVAYILSSIKQTVSADPRVANVDEIWFKANGDRLDISVAYHDINNAESKTSGRI